MHGHMMSNSLTTLPNSKCYTAPNSTLAVLHKLEWVCKEAVIACLKAFVRRDCGKVYIASYETAPVQDSKIQIRIMQHWCSIQVINYKYICDSDIFLFIRNEVKFITPATHQHSTWCQYKVGGSKQLTIITFNQFSTCEKDEKKRDKPVLTSLPLPRFVRHNIQ